jgi:replicative DNA helicase
MSLTSPDLIQTPLPSSYAAERAILAAVLIDNSTLWQARAALRAEWFHAEAHRLIFRALCHLADAGQALDAITVPDELRRRGELERVGGVSYLSGMIDGGLRLDNLEHYARLVKDKAVLRALVAFGNGTQQDALSGETDAAEALVRAQDRLARISSAALGEADDSAAAIADEFHAEFSNPDAPRGIHTGFAELDRLTGGFWPSDLWYLAAYTSTGKTSLAAAIALGVAASGVPVDFLSYEMSPKRVLARFISSGWRIDLGRLRHGRLLPDEYERYCDARDWLAAAPLRIVNAAGKTTADLRARAHRLKAEGKLGLTITDYIGLIPSRGRHSSRATEVAAISRELKQIAGEVDAPNLVLVQINREGAKAEGKPQLWWLRDSGGQENDADLVAFLVRDKDSSAGALHIEKQRDGALGEIPLHFEHAFARYTEGYQ